MRSSLHIIVIVVSATLVAAGCASTSAGTGGRACSPVLSWAAPAYRCQAAATQPEPEPEPEPVAEPEPEKEPEPEPEPEERVVVKEEKIEISERVQFRSGSATLMPQSEKLLAEVADAMKEHPEILRVRVEGHTDSRAGTRYNKKLSRARARSVRKYLIEQGVKPSRLVARGYGEKEPIAKNDSQEGRYKNRRVEFKILKRRK
jgi:outer membrane protein OmpA-like peptidoglycan-associated protein